MDGQMKKILDLLGGFLPIPEGIEFRPGAEKGTCRVTGGEIRYASKREALRGLGMAVSGAEGEARCDFRTLGVLLDCSRNAVPRIDWLKRTVVSLALMGYDHLELYMEDTFQCPGEPAFGYCRGAYSLEELRELDAFASKLGVEVCGAIQSLGHLEQVLKNDTFSNLRDTERILLAGDRKTYALLEKMIAFQSEAFRSRRINLGFDEAQGLGQGRFLEKNGYRNPFDIFTEHLRKVLDICRKYKLRPMIWSDMFFRIHHPGRLYYTDKMEVTPEMRSKMPEDVQLVYWDYYHWEEKRYLDMIRIHREMGFDPVMASMVWTPARLWYDHGQSSRTIPACVRAARTAGLPELIFTLWGDDGAYCDFDSALAGLNFAAGEVWGGDSCRLRQMYAAVVGGDYDKTLAASEMTVPQPGQFTAGLAASEVLWDDPLLGIGARNAEKRYPGALEQMRRRCERILAELGNSCGIRQGGDLGHAWTLCRAISGKIELRKRLEAGRFDPETREKALLLAEHVEALNATFRRQWLRRNKAFGLEVIQIRLAGLAERCREVARRIDEKMDFPELKETASPDGVPVSKYREMAAGCGEI